jgi:membrane protease YdiL (CAAX protease family)
LQQLSQTPLGLPEPGRLYRLGWGIYLGMALAACLWIGLRQGVIPLSLFVDLDDWWLDVLLGAGAGVLLLGLWWGTGRMSPLARDLERHLSSVLGALGPSETFALALLSGFAEELFFRGAVQGQLGWIAATILFALLHTGPGPAFRIWTAFAALAGVFFGAIMVYRGNLLGPIVGHILVNAINLRRLAVSAGGAGDDSARLAPRGEAQSQSEKES